MKRLAAIAVLSLLAILPSGLAASPPDPILEFFEDDNLNVNPSGSNYTYSEVNTGTASAFVVAGGPVDSTKQFQASSGSGDSRANFTLAAAACTIDFWSDHTSPATDPNARFVNGYVRLSSLDGSQYIGLDYVIDDGSSGNGAYDLQISTHATSTTYVNNESPGGGGASVKHDTYRHIYFDVCYAENTVYWQDFTEGFSGTLTTSFTRQASQIEVYTKTQSGLGSSSRIDNITTGATSEFASEFWCSAPAAVNFGYDFLEDVVEDTSEVGITIDPFYKFTGDSDDYGYLGKSFGGTNSAPTAGSTHMRSYFRIEAAQDASDTNFRSSFTFLRSNGTLAAPLMDKGTGTAAGDHGGQFREHVEVRFWEQGNVWDIRMFYVSQSNGVTVRTDIGASVTIDDPNNPHSYYFDVNTGSGTLELHRFDGTLLMSRPLPAVFSGDEIYGHFFVGFHTDVLGSPRTALDEDRNTDFSTCIEDLNAGTSFNGDPGSEPVDIEDPEESPTEISSFFIPDSSNIPAGFTQSAFALLLGILFMAAVAGGFYFTLGKSVMGAGIGAGAGFLGGFAFGLFPLWAVLLVALACIAVAVLRFRSGS